MEYWGPVRDYERGSAQPQASANGKEWINPPPMYTYQNETGAWNVAST